MRLLPAVLLASITSYGAFGQSYVISTMAGIGVADFSGDNGPATKAELYGPKGIAVDSAGNVYFADAGNGRVRRVSNDVITTVAGNGFGVGGDNGPAISAELNTEAQSVSVGVDSMGNLYIADSDNNRVRKVSNGVITTVAGNGTAGFSGDNGLATNAQLTDPISVAIDSAGNLYITDRGNRRIRKVSNGVITTVAGNGTCCSGGDNGPALNAPFGDIRGIAVDSVGNLYIADSTNNSIRKISN